MVITVMKLKSDKIVSSNSPVVLPLLALATYDTYRELLKMRFLSIFAGFDFQKII